MLILLPPSETKRPGGVGISLSQLAIIWAALEPTRVLLYQTLEKLAQNPDQAAKALGLGKRNLADIEANLELLTAPTMPALQRYTGVLYDALDFDSLSPAAIERAKEQLFIQSALFGLLPAMEQIPYYRLSAGSKLPGINLKQIWTAAHEAVWPRMVGPILDLRSKSYVELNPVPAGRESRFVEVMDDSGRALNHFNKKAKGVFVRAALEQGLSDYSEIPGLAQSCGLSATVSATSVDLFVPKGF